LNGKVRYSGTEKIEKKIYDELEGNVEARLEAIAEELRIDVISEIREELKPETVPYDRLRLIEQRIHEISTTQDGIVREIVDIKTTLNVLIREMDKLKSPKSYETKSYETNTPSYSSYEPVRTKEPAASVPYESPFSSYTPYPSAAPIIDSRSPTKLPGFGSAPAQQPPATPIAPVTFNTRKTDGWEYQEFMPAKKNNSEPEKFVPAKTIPAGNDPFYFADAEEEILDVSALNEPEYPTRPPEQKPIEDMFTVQKLKKQPEQEIPDKSEYIIGSNQKQKAEAEDDNNANCEYIIAEKDMGGNRFGRRRGKREPDKKEKIIASDEDGAEIITYE
jgi:hypothetical protein